MRTATLTRNESSDEGTFGLLVTDSGFEFVTGELPWRNNLSNKSCIPAGNYECRFRLSPRHGFCYHVENVPGRTDIEIHAANFMGDSGKGFICELSGCIAPGLDLGTMENQKALTHSRVALNEFEHDLDQSPFLLIVKNGIVLPPYDY